MRKSIFSFLFLASLMITSAGFFSSCSSSAHCPGTASTGNSSAMRGGGGGGGGHCPGTTSTGNWKPRKTHINERGLSSKKMNRFMQKHQNDQNSTAEQGVKKK